MYACDSSYPLASLYVGDLHEEVSESVLYEKFSPVGQIASIRVCRDSATQRSLRYAFVNFLQLADAEKALDTLNFDTLQGKAMRIMWCQRDPSVRKSGVGNVFIKNLEPSIDSKLLYDSFSNFGTILSCKVACDENGFSKGYGFVHYQSQESADQAIHRLNGMLFNDKKVFITRFKSRKERQQECAAFTNIYVNNFGKDMDDERLREIFSAFGTPLSVKVMLDANGRSRGFGFVSYNTHDEAQKAVTGMNGKEVNGHPLYAGRAKNKFVRQAELKKRFQQLKQEMVSRSHLLNLYVKNLDDKMDDERLWKQFSPYGTITSAKVMTNSRGHSKGFGFVCFTSPEEASKALSGLNGCIINGKPLYVALAQRKDDRKAMLTAKFSQRQKLMKVPPRPMLGTLQQPTSWLLPVWPQHPNRSYNQNPAMTMRPTINWPVQQFRPGQFPQPKPILWAVPPRCTTSRFNTFARVSPMNQKVDSIDPQTAIVNVQVNPSVMQAMAQNNYTDSVRNTEVGDMAVHLQPMVEPNVVMHEQETLTAANLALVPPQEQKELIGERLYLMVHSLNPAHAPRVTGMLLELENAELLQMLQDPEHLRSRVEEAISVLQVNNAIEGAIKIIKPRFSG